MSRREIIASAIANARVRRRGVPPHANILELLRRYYDRSLYEEVMDDADAVLHALAEDGVILQ